MSVFASYKLSYHQLSISLKSNKIAPLIINCLTIFILRNNLISLLSLFEKYFTGQVFVFSKALILIPN